MKLRKIRNSCLLGALVPLMGTAVALADPNTLVVTATNATNNQLLVYNTSGKLLQSIPTQGQGGAGGNSGGIQAQGNVVAVVNFGSQNVSLFEREEDGLRLTGIVPAVSKPLSVAFGTDHLYILGTTKVESHQMFGSFANPNPDGVVGLLNADGTAAQVGVLPDQLIITEKSNVIETVNLLRGGSVSGTPTAVQNIPANVNTPFGLITRGNNAYVTIAHADEISLVRNGKVLTVTPSVTQHAPCWLALAGPFLYSSNSPSMSISRYAVYGQKIVQDLAVAAQLSGSPTDIAATAGMVAVIDGNGPVSHLSMFSIDEDGNLALENAETINAPANGVAIVSE
jgi:hypothetical protein